MDRIDHGLRGIANGAGAPQKHLVQHETIVIRRYDDGSRYATHGRWDSASNRMVLIALSNPDASYPGQPWAVGALVQAAQEVELDQAMQQGLW